MENGDVDESMDEMPYGLYIIGSTMDGEVNGMMADEVMQVSFSPRLIAVAFENDSWRLQNIRAARMLIINELSQKPESIELAAKLAQPYYGAKVKRRTRTAADEVHHKLEGIEYTRTEAGCPCSRRPWDGSSAKPSSSYSWAITPL